MLLEGLSSLSWRQAEQLSWGLGTSGFPDKASKPIKGLLDTFNSIHQIVQQLMNKEQSPVTRVASECTKSLLIFGISLEDIIKMSLIYKHVLCCLSLPLSCWREIYLRLYKKRRFGLLNFMGL